MESSTNYPAIKYPVHGKFVQIIITLLYHLIETLIWKCQLYWEMNYVYLETLLNIIQNIFGSITQLSCSLTIIAKTVGKGLWCPMSFCLVVNYSTNEKINILFKTWIHLCMLLLLTLYKRLNCNTLNNFKITCGKKSLTIKSFRTCWYILLHRQIKTLVKF